MNLTKTITELCEKIGPRAPGSFGERRAAEYINKQFKNMGIHSKIESFSSPSHLAISSIIESEIEFFNLSLLRVRFNGG